MVTSHTAYRRVVHIASAAGLAMLVSCGGNAEKKPGQSVARVDDYEITVHQLNNELKQAGRDAANADPATLQKQALESVIDRQLLIAEAQRNKVDRDPEVMQAIELAKNRIIAQAHLQRKLTAIAKPTQTEVESYFQQNPALFTNRKLFEMRQVVIAARDFSDEVKRTVDTAKTVDDVTAWLDGQKIQYVKGAASRTTADLPQAVVANIDVLSKGKPFVVKDPERVTISSLFHQKDIPVALADATPQIEQFLVNRKSREAITAELSRLRASAKIEYLNEGVFAKAAAAPTTVAATESGSMDNGHIAKGISGLK